MQRRATVVEQNTKHVIRLLFLIINLRPKFELPNSDRRAVGDPPLVRVACGQHCTKVAAATAQLDPFNTIPL